ncbi:unnamed protein product [Pieris brassicae]|uniref:Mutator-like transposase domain-containing protein n=1 Tax=Pieris brassicae TaxID=7116 RepID=A0A9P0XDK3_PIEBR|nr:unnamed protein product [Pieris brassicae]
MFESACKKAAEEEKELNVQNGRPADHLKVSGDGSWKKRGYTSLYGVTTLIGYYSGKVIDLADKSGYCHTCAIKKKTLKNGMKTMKQIVLQITPVRPGKWKLIRYWKCSEGPSRNLE